jgi:glycosyltransferase involved in cell wall biosynthesis
MRILLIHQAFVAAHEAGGTRHYELGQRLRTHGDELTVVASQVNYLTGQPIDAKRTGIAWDERVGDLRVIRAYTPSVLHRGFVWRVLAFVIFGITSVWAGLRAGPVDLVMGTSPPIFQAFSACLIAFIRRKPFLLEIRDLWPEFAIDMGLLRHPVLIMLARWGEGFLYARATHLLVNSPAYRDYLLKKGIHAQKISVVPNGVEIDMFTPDAAGEQTRAEYGLEQKFVVTYAGAHGPANDLGVVLRAAARLRDRPEIHFLMVGDGKDRSHLEGEAARLQLQNVTFTGALPKNRMPDVLAASNACLAILQNIPMFKTTYPNKVFDYMAAGRPTILAIDGVIRQVIEAADAGVFVPPGDDAHLAEAVTSLASDRAAAQMKGQRARAYVSEYFDRARQADAFRSVCVGMITRQTPRSSD